MCFAAETGLCEVGGICSFVDQECPSGRRYGNAAGALTNHCVEYPDGGGNAEGWFDTNFQQRIRFTIASPVGEALPEFPVLTVLREADFDHETIVALSSMRLIHNDSVVPVQFEIADQNRGIEVGFWFKADLPETEELEYFIYFDPKQPQASPTLQGGVEVTVPTEEATPLQVGEWAWLGFYVGDRLQLFIDGEPVGPSVPRTTAIAPPNAGDLQIGRDLRGDLDDVRISLQCHSPARLQADYLAVQTPLPQLGFVEAL